jgi:LmbE family N-acetylglucosaminyl deacetylase
MSFMQSPSERDPEFSSAPQALECASHDAAWSSYFAARPGWSPREGELLVVAPHPDDEVLGAGGLIRAWAARAAKVTVLSVSDGEAADPQRQALASVRRGELNESLRKLCPTHISVTRLGLPDGQITHHLNRVRNALLSLAGATSTLIAPYQHDGHPDHEAVGNACIEFARARQLPLARYAIRLWQRESPAALGAGQWVKFMLSDDARRAKARAVQCFKSPLAANYCDRAYEPFLL